MFLSGDRFTFDFAQMEPEEALPERYFEFGEKSAWQPDSVLMFSGGLDSFAGALEEIIDRKQKVALISHFSATKIDPIQRDLKKHMADKLPPPDADAFSDAHTSQERDKCGRHASTFTDTASASCKRRAIETARE